MVIEWDYLIVEMFLLAGIIWFTVYIEHWAYRRSQLQDDKKTRNNIFIFIKDDLEHRLHFIEESLQYKDYKPFFTDMWDSIILSGKQSLLSFELFQSVQRTYSWMKYYNSELEANKNNSQEEKILIELLADVQKSINRSLEQLNKEKN
ncbi:MAG: hypothetical protein MRJ93_03185 [Nitrososphaeraceae archaeon]|nr:hypothetical protein [Nitrososphaeraceae archaeon]